MFFTSQENQLQTSAYKKRTHLFIKMQNGLF